MPFENNPEIRVVMAELERRHNSHVVKEKSLRDARAALDYLFEHDLSTFKNLIHQQMERIQWEKS